MLLKIIYEHNHSINSADALRCRPIGEGVKRKLMKLFEESHSPSSAYQTFKDELVEEYGDKYLVQIVLLCLITFLCITFMLTS